MKMDGEAVRYFSICIIHYSFINCSRLLLACIVALIVGCTGRGDATPAASSVGVAESQQREVAQRLFDSAVEMLNRLDSYDQGGVEVPVQQLVRRLNESFEAGVLEGEQVEPFTFDDGRFIRELVWLRGAARVAVGDEHDPLRRAEQLFDWTIRCLQYIPHAGHVRVCYIKH